MKEHTEKWFLKQEARLEEPLKNTIRYYGKTETIKISMAWLPVAGWILAISGAVNLLKLKKYINSYSNLTAEFMNNGRAVTSDGPPGAGKTFTSANVAYKVAINSWEKLKSDYLTQRTMVAQWIKTGETDKLEQFKALEESYRFFAEREDRYIPCLVSSIPLREYGTGRMSYQLTPEMFLQIDRIAEYTVLLNDESGLTQGVDKSKTDNKDYLAFWRFPRHFFNGYFLNTNQDGDQNAIAMRRSTDYVNHLYGQEWLMRPVLLEWRYKKKEYKYYKKLMRGKLSGKRAEYIGQKLYYMRKYYQTIGFRRIKHKLATPEGVAVSDVEELILPAIGGVQYDDRSYRKLYKCKDKPIEMRGWDKLVVEEYDDSEFDKRVKGVGNA